MSYKNMEIWQLAKEVESTLRSMSLEATSKIDVWKEGTEIRRSAKEALSSIVEAYNKRGNKQNFIKYLNAAIDANNETKNNLSSLFTSGALQDKQFYHDLRSLVETVNAKSKEFIDNVEREHGSQRKTGKR